MKCSLFHLIFIIIFGSVVSGFSIPKVDVKVLQPKGIQFSLKGIRYQRPGSNEASYNRVSCFSLSEDSDVIISDIRVIFGASSKLKFAQAQLTRNGNGIWNYDEPTFEWNADDNIEYWLSVENSNFGYFTNKIVKVQGNHDRSTVNSCFGLMTVNSF